MTEPAPRRHRRRERRRSRPAGTGTPPAGADGAPGESAATGAGAPVERPPAGKERRRFGRRFGERGASAPPDPAAAGAGNAAVSGRPGGGTDRADRTDLSGGAGAAGEGGEPAPARPRPARRPDIERGLRGIVGAGPSQVGVLGAMRARDAAKPTAEDLAAAERDLLIVRRHYVPSDPDPR